MRVEILLRALFQSGNRELFRRVKKNIANRKFQTFPLDDDVRGVKDWEEEDERIRNNDPGSGFPKSE